MLTPWAISYLNNMLDNGVEIPIPDWIKAPITKPRFKQYQGYYLFDSEPKEEASTDLPNEPEIPLLASSFLQWLSFYF